MSKILSVALFASYAAAQTTASIWMPGMEDSGVSYEASVISLDGDHTVMSVDVKGITLDGSLDDVPATITVGGNTYYGYEAANSDYDVTVTISGACSRQNTDEAEVTCEVATKGFEAAISSLCADPEYATECAEGIDEPLPSTVVLPEGYFNMFPVVITEGGDSLPSATAAATVSISSASVTASRSTVTSSASRSAAATGSDSESSTGSDSESATGASASPTSSNLEEATGAAQMMQVPALAGIGAAVAAFFL